MANRNSHTVKGSQRAYSLTSDGLPVYVGDGLGDITFEEAIDLAIIFRTARGLPADRDFILAHVPTPIRMRDSSVHSRASKNNPYLCPHCEYKATRYANMVKHLMKIHGDYSTDPRR